MRPPYSNRGVYPPPEGSPSAHAEGFDAYCFTAYVTSSDGLISDLFCLLESAGLEPTQVEGPRVPYYATNTLLLAPTGHRLLSVRSGGQGTNIHPFVEVKGEASQLVAQYVRQHYRHRPARIDHAIDRHAPGLFQDLASITKAMAAKYRLRWELLGDQVTPDSGLTVYLGSRKSQVFVRIYEKGLKYANELGIPVTDDLRNWVRIELEFKPQNKRAKDVAAVIEPAQMWGSTQWTADLSERVLSMAAEPISIRERRESNRDRAIRFMKSQYRSHLLSLLLEECQGDPAELGRLLFSDLADEAAARAA